MDQPIDKNIEKIAVLMAEVTIVTRSMEDFKKAITDSMKENKETINSIKFNVERLDKGQREMTFSLSRLDERFGALEKKTNQSLLELEKKSSRFSSFLKNNWYKLGIVVIAVGSGTIGYIMEYLHNLPPPVRL